MAALQCVEALERAVAVLDEHYRVCDERFGGKFNDLGVESRKRLKQMIWLLSEIGRYLEMEANAQKPLKKLGARAASGEISSEEWHLQMRSPEMSKLMCSMPRISEPLETLSEAFYWIAFRARRVIRMLPDMGSFEAEGVRNTRNKLIEHAEGKDSGVVISSFGWGAPQGPVIKAIRYGEHADLWPDQGLFNNAAEFAERLRALAEDALAKARNSR